MAASEIVRGVDVSNHQGAMDWEAVAWAGYAFAFIKASEGTYYRDPYFAGNWSQSKAAGLQRGSYHFARPSSSPPDAEAAFFLDAVERAGGLDTGDMLVLDLEDTNYAGGGSYGDAGHWALGFCQYIEAVAGFPPLVYWGSWYLSDQIARTPELAAYGLWLAAYGQQMPPPPAPWDVIAFWQHSSTGRVPGVNGDCDLNVFNGTAERIALYGKPAAEEPKPSPYAVGAGLLTAMQTRGDQPASDEVFFKKDTRDAWSEAFGQSGRRYIWLPSIGRVFVYEPVA